MLNRLKDAIWSAPQEKAGLRVLKQEVDVFTPPEHRQQILTSSSVFGKYIDPKFGELKLQTEPYAGRLVSVYESTAHWCPKGIIDIHGGFERFMPEWQVVEFCRRYHSFFMEPSLSVMGCDSMHFILGRTENGDLMSAKLYSAIEGLEIWLERFDFQRLNSGWKIVIPDE